MSTRFNKSARLNLIQALCNAPGMLTLTRSTYVVDKKIVKHDLVGPFFPPTPA